MSWAIKNELDFAVKYLSEHGCKNSRLSAEYLLSDVLNMSFSQLRLNFDNDFDDSLQLQFRKYLDRRAAGEPVQYITGKAYFWNLEIDINPGVLIPRPETEILVENICSYFSYKHEDAFKIADLCTGSACVAIALAGEFYHADVYATDISDLAIDCAKKNVRKHNLEDRITVLKGNLGEPIKQNFCELLSDFDLVVSNPPYVPAYVLDGIDKEVVDYEPLLALDGGKDGLKFVPDICKFAYCALHTDGVLALELHETSLEAAKIIVENSGFKYVKILNDLAGRPRYIFAQKKAYK